MLKPCPFCGFRPSMSDEDFLHPVDRERTVWSANCPPSAGGCSASTLGRSREDALAKWNRRAAVSERGTLTNREEGYLSLLEAHCEILRARVKTPHRNHAVIEWERELAAVEWAIKRARPAERKDG